MAKQSQVTIPLGPLSVGTFGPFTSPSLPSTLSGYVVDFTNDSSWPATGDVLKIQIDISNDNGGSWQFDASVTFAGGTWKTRDGLTTVNSTIWNVSINNTGSSTRKMRVTMTVMQACTLGATFSSV